MFTKIINSLPINLKICILFRFVSLKDRKPGDNLPPGFFRDIHYSSIMDFKEK